jgi:hypothetical protein
MKSNLFRLSLNLLLILAASFCFGQNPNEIKFEKPVQKFRKVDEGHQLTFTYFFTYFGKEKLSIIPPKVDCSCTKVILPKGEIESEKTYFIVIKFDTKDKIGYQEREVTLQFVSDKMDSTSIEKKITFKGVVKASKATKKAYKENKKKEKILK